MNGLPWSYEQKVRDFLKPGVRVLSIGADGGRYLLSLGHPPELVSAAEGQDGSLPFGDDSFDLVVAYHTGCNLGEVSRVLCRGGFFVTQQIGGRNQSGRPDYNLENEGPKLEAAGFRMMYSHQAYYLEEGSGTFQHRFIMIGKAR